MKEMAPRHIGEGRKWLGTNRTIFTEMPGMKETTHRPAWWRRERMVED
jgi:hypothetical protein